MGRFKVILGVSILMTLSAICQTTVTPTTTYTSSAALVDNDVFTVFWNFTDTTITFEVHAKVLGWVGFGISPNGGMAGSDIVIGYVKDGTPYFTDRHATGNLMPVVDASQDWTLLSASETSEFTILKFSRNLTVCDSDDISITSATLRVIFAYSTTDPSSESAVAYHGSSRGVKSMMFLTGNTVNAPALPADAFYIDYLNNNVTIPHSSDTTYMCRGFNSPNITGKNHLIKIEPLIQSGNEAYVHHMLLYACFHTPTNISTATDEFVCYTPNMPWDECAAPIVAWAIGGGDFNFPAHTGLPFGDVSMNQILYLRMETHYDNPNLAQGIMDTSGLRLWFTPTLRTYDAGLIQAGMMVNPLTQILPGGYSTLTMHGHCTAACLSEAMNTQQDIKVFATALHTHLLGTGVRVRQYRNGVEQPYLDEDLSYDFNYQESRMLQNEVTIQKGDNLVTECIYKTSGRTNATFAGLGTTNEMCMAFLFYYPAINVSQCGSQPTQPQMAQGLEYNYVSYASAYGELAILTDQSNSPLHTYLGTIGQFPDAATRQKYQNAILNGQIMQQCGVSGSVGLSSHFQLATIPTITSAYSAPCPCNNCNSANMETRPSILTLVTLTIMSLLTFMSA